MKSASNPVIAWETMSKPMKVIEISGRKLETRENPIHIKDKPPKKTAILAVLSCFKKFFLLAYILSFRVVRTTKIYMIKKRIQQQWGKNFQRNIVAYIWATKKKAKSRIDG